MQKVFIILSGIQLMISESMGRFLYVLDAVRMYRYGLYGYGGLYIIGKVLSEQIMPYISGFSEAISNDLELPPIILRINTMKYLLTLHITQLLRSS